jgi:uncharacterized protein
MIKFQWDEAKRLTNIEKHHLDFKDVVPVFMHPQSLVIASPRSDEDRFLMIGEVNTRIISVVFVQRNEAIRIISARAARKEEKLRWLKNMS